MFKIARLDTQKRYPRLALSNILKQSEHLSIVSSFDPLFLLNYCLISKTAPRFPDVTNDAYLAR